MTDPTPAAEALPEPPWRERKEGPRTPLTRQAIVEAALRVLDRDGMDALSMRKVGEELGTGAASLYWHVRNKDELLQLVFEAVSEETTLPAPDPSRWQGQLRDLAHEMRRSMNRHRDVARISLGRIPAGPTLANYSEWLFELMQPVGIPDQVIAYLGDLMGLYIGAVAFEESLGSPPPPARTCRRTRSSRCSATTSRRCRTTASPGRRAPSICCSAAATTSGSSSVSRS